MLHKSLEIRAQFILTDIGNSNNSRRIIGHESKRPENLYIKLCDRHQQAIRGKICKREEFGGKQVDRNFCDTDNRKPRIIFDFKRPE